MTVARRRLLLWGAVAIVAVGGVVTTEYAKRANVHDYASKYTPMVWPDHFALDRSDLVAYLEYQFNVDGSKDRDSDGANDLVIKAGLCQLAGSGAAGPIDVIAADATLLIAQQPWFDEFVAVEKPEMNKLHASGAWTDEDLRRRFIENLAAMEAFQSDFPRFLEDVAARRNIEVTWNQDDKEFLK